MNQWKPKHNFTKPIRNVRTEQNSQNFKNITQYSQNPKHKKNIKYPHTEHTYNLPQKSQFQVISQNVKHLLK